MIGKSLSERFGALKALDPDVAKRALVEVLGERGKDIVDVRAQGAEMVACVVVEADDGAVRLCRALGLEMRKGGTAVFGLRGADAASRVPSLTDAQRAWLRERCGERETKVVLLRGGVAVLAIDVGGSGEGETGRSIVRAT